MDASIPAPAPGPSDAPGPSSEPRRSILPKIFSEGGETHFDLVDIFRVLRRQRSVIIACVLVVTALSAGYVYQITPRYTAESSVILDTRKTDVVDVQAVLSGLSADATAIRSEVEVIKSPAIAEKVVQKLDLVNNPLFNGKPQGPPSLFASLRQIPHELFAQLKPLLGFASPAPVDTGADPAQTALLNATRAVQAHTDIVNDGRSYVLRIRVELEDPKLAAAIANALADAYLDAQLEAKFDAVRRANTWLNEHLTELRNQVEATDQAVQVFEVQHNLVSDGKNGATVNQQQLSELNTQLILAAADRAQKEANLKQVQDQLRSGGVDSSPQILSSSLVQSLRTQESAVQQQLAQLATKYKPEHPAMINLRAQQADLEQKINAVINQVVRGIQGEVETARAKEASLRASLQLLENSSATQDEAQVQLRELQRQADSNRTLYENFLNRFKQTSAQEDIQQPDARLLAQAFVPTSPSYPRTGSMMAMAIVGSVLLGFAAAFFVERLDNGFRTGEQIEQIAHATPLGLVPDLKSNELPYDVIVTHPVSPYAEAVRTARTALRYSDVDHPPKVVMVTSSLPDEGKSVFALSLARSVAISGGRALLIDCDFRRPTMAKLLKIDPKPDILSLFEPNGDFKAVLRIDERSGLHFLPSVPGTTNPQDLLGSKQFRMLIDKLRLQYDFIVIDTPPILAVSDALILSHIVDTTMFLVRWGRTARPVALGALKSFRQNGGSLAGIVLSRVDFRKHATYGYGDSGYYYGHYGSHYGAYAQYGGKPYAKS